MQLYIGDTKSFACRECHNLTYKIHTYRGGDRILGALQKEKWNRFKSQLCPVKRKKYAGKFTKPMQRWLKKRRQYTDRMGKILG